MEGCVAQFGPEGQACRLYVMFIICVSCNPTIIGPRIIMEINLCQQVCLSLLTKRARSYTSMLPSEHLFQVRPMLQHEVLLFLSTTLIQVAGGGKVGGDVVPIRVAFEF